MAVTLQYCKGRAWRERDHQLCLLDGGDQVILLCREKQRWRSQLVETIANVVGHEKLQAVQIAVAAGSRRELHESSHLVAMRMGRVKPEGRRSPDQRHRTPWQQRQAIARQ